MEYTLNRLNGEKSVSQEQKENGSIRLKVTEKCPWECRFCHREGGWGIDDVRWDEAMQKNIKILKDSLELKEVHLTGGEPTSNKYLEELAEGLVSLGLSVKMTTNGQFNEKKLDGLMRAGINEFNFSIHALNLADFIVSQRNNDLDWAQKNIENQKKSIIQALERGANVKLNILISDGRDIEKSLEVFRFAKNHGIPLRFLNDLNNGEVSINVINKMVEEILNGEKFKEATVNGSSSKSSYYRDKDGFEFGVKEIRDYKLKTLCGDCNESCGEQFYGIRLEQRDGTFYVRLCLDRKDGKNLMTVGEFMKSEQLAEIIKLLK